MTYSNVEVQREGYVGVIRMNRPERLNALSSGLTRDLNDALDELDVAFPEIRVIVLTGNGRGFCSGADVEGQIASASGQAGRPGSARGWRLPPPAPSSSSSPGRSSATSA